MKPDRRSWPYTKDFSNNKSRLVRRWKEIVYDSGGESKGMATRLENEATMIEDKLRELGLDRDILEEIAWKLHTLDEANKAIVKARLQIKRAQKMDSKIKVFLDDETEASERQKLAQGYDIWVTTPEEVIELLKKGNVSHVSLDHDLRLEPDTRNGYMVAKFIEEGAYFGTLPELKWRVHSQNPSGRANMEAALRSADRYWAIKKEENHE